MRRSWKKIFISRLLSCGMAVCLIASLVGFKASAAEKPYTYSVTIHAGRQGTIKELSGPTVTDEKGNKTDGYTVTATGDKVVISGLEYGQRVTFDVKDSVVMKDVEDAGNQDDTVSGGNASVSRYQVRGLRESGRDNGEAAPASFVVTEDRDYVVAYSINGKMVAYTVNYQDENGNKLAESRTYYGNVGDMPVVGYVYIDNYKPQAYNLTKTLDADETKNVFTFIYTPMERGGGGGGAGTNETVTVVVPGENAGIPLGATTTIGQGGAAAGGAAPGGGAGGGAGEPAQAPEAPQELVNLDDEDVPLANVEGEDEKVPLAGKEAGDRAFPLVAGIVIAVLAAVTIVVAVILAKKRKEKKEEEDSADKKE